MCPLPRSSGCLGAWQTPPWAWQTPVGEVDPEGSGLPVPPRRFLRELLRTWGADGTPTLLQNYFPSQEGLAHSQFIRTMIIFSVAFIVVLVLKVRGGV